MDVYEPNQAKPGPTNDLPVGTGMTAADGQAQPGPHINGNCTDEPKQQQRGSEHSLPLDTASKPSPGQTSAADDLPVGTGEASSESSGAVRPSQSTVPLTTPGTAAPLQVQALRCSICGAEREDRRISVRQVEGEAERPYCNDNPVCIGLVKIPSLDLYCVEAIPPDGEPMMATAYQMSPTGPVPVMISDPQLGDKQWEMTMAQTPKMKEGTILRLIRFSRASLIRQYIVPSKTTELAA